MEPVSHYERVNLMFKQKMLVGSISDFLISQYLLELRNIASLHKLGDSFIELPYWGVRYDALAFSHLLKGLEDIAKANGLIVKPTNAESSLDELLGLQEDKDIELSLSFASWTILADVDRRMHNDGNGGVPTVIGI